MSSAVDIVLFTDCSTSYWVRASGAYRIASELRSHGYTVQVIDHFLLLGLKRTLALLDKFIGANTLFVGFSTTFMNPFMLDTSDSSFKLTGYYKVKTVASTSAFAYGVPITYNDMKALKDRALAINPKVKFVVGGPRADAPSFQPLIDTFIMGYADTTVVEYAKFLQGKNPFFQARQLGNGRLVIEHDKAAARFDFKTSKINYHASDAIEPGEVLPIEVARGCIFRCKFCSFPLIGKRKMDHIKLNDTLYSELMYNYEKFGTTRYIFSDDTHNDSLEKLEHLSKVFTKLPFKLEYVAYLRLDLIRRFPEQADLLLNSGLKSAVFGIETLNASAGKIIGKGLDPEKVKETLTWLREEKGWKNNVLMTSGFIVGLPTETPETVMKWAVELCDFSYPLDSFIVVPLWINPMAKRDKSEFELNAEKYGYRFEDKSLSNWKNDIWSYEEAQDLSNNIMNYAYTIGRLKEQGFMGMMLHNYGVTWEQLHNEASFGFKQQFYKQTLKMTDKYFARLMAL